MTFILTCSSAVAMERFRELMHFFGGEREPLRGQVRPQLPRQASSGYQEAGPASCPAQAATFLRITGSP